MTQTGTLEPLFPDVWLHERPRVTRTKGQPTFRVSRADAFGFEYIEPNVTGQIQSLIITDRDLPDADRIAEHLGLPAPSWVSINPYTTSGHIAYVLKDPVTLTDAARRPPVNLLARIEHGLAVVLEGDPGYTGGLTKNPTHSMHPTLWGPEEARYGLRELAAALSDIGALPRSGNARKNVSRSAVGRNVALFDATRLWAYRSVYRYRGAQTSDWDRAVLQYASRINSDRIGNDFSTGPLTLPEVGHTAKSVANWVWQEYTPAKQSSWGQRLAKASSTSRAKTRLKLFAEIAKEA